MSGHQKGFSCPVFHSQSWGFSLNTSVGKNFCHVVSVHMKRMENNNWSEQLGLRARRLSATGLFPLWVMAPSISKPPFMAEALKSVSSCHILPGHLEDFDICPHWSCSCTGVSDWLLLLQQPVPLGWLPAGMQRDEASGHVMCARVARGNEVQTLGSIQGSSLCCQWCPFPAHPTVHFLYFSCSHTCASHHAAPCLTLYARRVASDSTIFKFPLNTYFSSWIFQRKSGFGLFYFLLILLKKKKTRKFPSSLQNVAIKSSGFISLS